MQNKMTIKERILHSLLFELIALAIIVSFSVAVTEHNSLSVSGIAITVSVLAMIWNYIYNLGFDKVYGNNRLQRSFIMRFGHAIGFEVGLLIVDIPLIMWALDLDIYSVLLLNIGFTLFFVLYAMVFNWVFDNVREHMVLS
jgi:uncharacterized membrane protein